MKIESSHWDFISLGRAVVVWGIAVGLFWGPTEITAEVVLVEDGRPLLPVVIPEGAPPATRQAANELVDYIEKISGARPSLLVGAPDPMDMMPERAIWVGYQPHVGELFPDVNFDLAHPEEILLISRQSQVVIVGRDSVIEGKQVEKGTAWAVYTFLQDWLDVRWLWPGPLGEDIIERASIRLPHFEYNYWPQFRIRQFYNPQYHYQAVKMGDDWWRHQRTTGREKGAMDFHAGEAYMDWWDAYAEDHPEYFALRENGTREPQRWGGKVHPKLCVSNPAVAAQWLENAGKTLSQDPARTMLSATPNDGGGFCVCVACQEWDHPDAPAGVLTERYVRYWNSLARGLKERFPERDVQLGVMAYSVYSSPPIDTRLEDNIAVGYVGHFPLTTPAARNEQKKGWLAWAGQASMIVYRPNLWYWGGGVWGMPEVALDSLIEDMQFLAENSGAGIIVDSVQLHWVTQGPSYYLLAQLAWNPLQDGAALLDDYYCRAFGPAADHMAEYWQHLDQARQEVMASTDFSPGGMNRVRTPAVFANVYDDDFFKQAEHLLDEAADKVKNEPGRYAERVAFVRTGLDFTRLMVANVPLMERVRDSNGTDRQAVEQVIKNWDAIRELYDTAGLISFNYSGVLSHMRPPHRYMGMMQDYFGPPSDDTASRDDLTSPHK